MIKNEWKKSVLCGDSKDIIKRLPDHSIDFILTDPPYNIGKHSTGNIPLPGRTAMNNDVADWDWVDFNPEEWADEFVRILKPEGNLFIFTSYNQLGRWYNCLDKRFDTTNFMIWHKTNPAPKIFKAGFLNSCEMIFTCWNKKHTWNFISQAEMHNFLESPICMRPERLSNPKHPAQKPISILKKIIEIASNKGDIIFDPFMGVGSVGVAALQKERRFIGVEINKEYFMAAKNRINTELEKNDTLLRELSVEAMYGNGNDLLPFTTTICRRMDKEPLEPILKWAGGKEKELKFIIPNAPARYNNYYEPFVGGGAVFTAVNANRYFINDLSSELVALYRNISSTNPVFFEHVNNICASWEMATIFFREHLQLIKIYRNFREGDTDEVGLKNKLKMFVSENETEIDNITKCFGHHKDVFMKELYHNLARKMLRMRVLEKERNILPENDLYDNIETAIKSGLYMYLRFLYNDKTIVDCYPDLHNALFLFIRNYCYSGMFRYNSNGDFNVPYGGIGYNSKTMEKKVNYYRSKALLEKFHDTEIDNLDFEAFLRKHNPKANDFIFLDPPYDSEFSTYAQNAFNADDQRRLANYITNECKAQWMLIIKNTDFIRSLYEDKGLTIRSFDKTYTVSFMNRNNKKTEHLLITNY